MKPVLIFGAGQVAETFAEYLVANRLHVKAFVVDRERLTQPSLRDVPVVAFEDVERTYSTEAHSFIVGISFRGMNAMRALKYEAMKAKGYEPLTFVDRHARVAPSAKIGPGSVILDGNVIQTGTVVEENVVCWSGNHLGHHGRIGAHTWICSHVVVSGACEIGEASFLGVNATVIDGKKLGKRVLIGAGALAKTNLPDDAVLLAPRSEVSKVPSYRVL